MLETILGSALLLVWTLVVLWSLAKVALSVRQRDKHKEWDSRSFAVGLIAGAALVGGVLLTVTNMIVRFDTFGFLLALAGTLVVWLFAKEASL